MVQWLDPIKFQVTCTHSDKTFITLTRLKDFLELSLILVKELKVLSQWEHLTWTWTCLLIEPSALRIVFPFGSSYEHFMNLYKKGSKSTQFTSILYISMCFFPDMFTTKNQREKLSEGPMVQWADPSKFKWRALTATKLWVL